MKWIKCEKKKIDKNRAVESHSILALFQFCYFGIISRELRLSIYVSIGCQLSSHYESSIKIILHLAMRQPNRHSTHNMVVYNFLKVNERYRNRFLTPHIINIVAIGFFRKIHANKIKMAQKSSATSANETLISNLESQLDRLVEQLKDLEECKWVKPIVLQHIFLSR